MENEVEKLKEHIVELEERIKNLKNDLIHDPLTGLKTRKFFNERVEIYISNIVKVNEGKRRDWFGFKSLSILFIDIDYFKKINDTYGHDVGDMVLKKVAETISKKVRSGDVICRFGGEEILVLLLGTDNRGALEKAEQIRGDVESIKFETPEDLNVTVSIGVATYEDGITREVLVKRADQALYKAKETGRNKVVTFSEI